MLKKQPDLTEDAKNYITKYQLIYRKVIREAKRWQNDKHILHANYKSKAVWQIINRETGRTSLNRQDIKINWNSEEITNPEIVAELFNSYFCKISEELLKKNRKNMPNYEKQYLKIKKSTKTMFQLTENELEKVAKGLTNISSAGTDEISDCVVKQCIIQLKKPLTNIYNVSLETGIFPDQLKIAKLVPVHKKGDEKECAKLQTNSTVICVFKIAREIGI